MFKVQPCGNQHPIKAQGHIQNDMDLPKIHALALVRLHHNNKIGLMSMRNIWRNYSNRGIQLGRKVYHVTQGRRRRNIQRLRVSYRSTLERWSPTGGGKKRKNSKLQETWKQENILQRPGRNLQPQTERIDPAKGSGRWISFAGERQDLGQICRPLRPTIKQTRRSRWGG